VVVQQQAKVARVDHRWSVVAEEEVGGVGGRFKGRKGERNGSFTLLDVFVSYKTHPREIWLTWAS